MAGDVRLGSIVERILAGGGGQRIRVAIDGIDASGKTTLADELAGLLEKRGQNVIRASIDGFHNPQAVRYACGALSAAGYFHDSFNHDALISSLLAPLGPDGDGRYRTAVYDHRADEPLETPLMQAPAEAILLFDGVFLGRPELVPYWELFIFVEITFETCLARAIERDQIHLGSEAEVRRRYQARYLPGQKLYLETCRPKTQADIIFNNDDPAG